MANSVTTTVTTTTGEQSGWQLQVGSTTDTTTVGDFVTGVTIQPYIAPRIISFYAYNLRPFHPIHVFFDGVNVDQYVARGAIPTSIPNTSDWQSIEKISDWGQSLDEFEIPNAEGAVIYTDAAGQCAGLFNIPEGVFRTGERILELANVTDLVLGEDSITTKATATFTASNLNVTRQSITLTTVNPVLSYIPVSNSFVTQTTNVVITPLPNVYKTTASFTEPIAQGLTINTPAGEAGVFATSLDIYFKQKSSIGEHGVTIYLCETDNGYPNGNAILPFSIVHKNAADIIVSSNSSVPTTFTFEAPVFLSNGKTYAFIVKPDANDPDFYVWTANLGDIDVLTGFQVFQQPVTGTAFFGATMTQWTALQTEYLKFLLRIANFYNASGDAYFTHSNTDYLSIYNIAYAETDEGMLPGDYVYQSTNSTPNTVITSKKGILTYFDSVKNLLYVGNTSGTFTSNSFVQIHRFANAAVANSPGPNSTTLVAYANTGIMYQPLLDAFVPQLATISPSGTTLTHYFSGTSNTYDTDTNEIRVSPGFETEFFDKERRVLGKSDEVALLGGAKSLKLHSVLTTDSTFVSPVIDLVRNQQLVLGNDIDPIDFNYNEFFNSGNTKSKYISKVVTLAEGQDAQDISVTLTAYRPPGSDIQVWIRFLNGDDVDPISTKIWAPLINTAGGLYSDPSNPGDKKEFVYAVPRFYGMVPLSGVTTSTNTDANVTGVGTVFSTELQPGWYVNMLSEGGSNELTRKVLGIANNTQITLDEEFNGNYTAQTMFLVPPPSTPWLAQNFALFTAIVNTSVTNNAITGQSLSFIANTSNVNNTTEMILIANAHLTFSANDRVYYYVPQGNTPLGGLNGNTWYYVQSSNSTGLTITDSLIAPAINVTATTDPGDTHYFTTSAFDKDFRPGSIIAVGSDRQEVVTVVNSTYLTVGTPWTAEFTQANAYIETIAGVSYLNQSNNLFTTYKKFQVKIILQSNDTSKVPIIDDLRILALQL